MDVQGILQKIESDAREAASIALTEAQKRADEIRAQSERQAQAQRTALEERIQSDAREMESRMLRMAELEDKKEQLSVKRQVMDEAFAEALNRLTHLPAGEKRAFFLKELLLAARGDEQVCVGDQESAWFDAQFLADANAALKEKGIAAALQQGQGVPGCGFELRRGGEALNCTFESLVNGRRLTLEGDVAQALFSE